MSNPALEAALLAALEEARKADAPEAEAGIMAAIEAATEAGEIE